MSEAVQQAPSGANFYSLAKNNPEVLQKRQHKIDNLNERSSLILKTNPGRRPNWDQDRLLRLDAFSLQHGKRCIMWDDQGAGFFLLINWDWKNNIPATPTSSNNNNNKDHHHHSYSPGWWHTVKKYLSPPLIDPTVSDGGLAAWLDTHTMKVHCFDVGMVVEKEVGEGNYYCIEGGEYGEKLQQYM